MFMMIVQFAKLWTGAGNRAFNDQVVNSKSSLGTADGTHRRLSSGFFCGTPVIELDDGKIYRKPLYLMVKTMVSCRFSLQPIHWTCFFGWETWANQWQRAGSSTLFKCQSLHFRVSVEHVFFTFFLNIQTHEMLADIFADSSQQNDRTPIILAEVEVSRISTTGAGLEIWSVSDQSSVFYVFFSGEFRTWKLAVWHPKYIKHDIRFHIFHIRVLWAQLCCSQDFGSCHVPRQLRKSSNQLHRQGSVYRGPVRCGGIHWTSAVQC